VRSLREAAQQLAGAVEPLGRIVDRLPGGRRRGHDESAR
jgi:hypothetical protein